MSSLSKEERTIRELIEAAKSDIEAVLLFIQRLVFPSEPTPIEEETTA